MRAAREGQKLKCSIHGIIIVEFYKVLAGLMVVVEIIEACLINLALLHNIKLATYSTSVSHFNYHHNDIKDKWTTHLGSCEHNATIMTLSHLPAEILVRTIEAAALVNNSLDHVVQMRFVCSLLVHSMYGYSHC